jgi:hypothetical protein
VLSESWRPDTPAISADEVRIASARAAGERGLSLEEVSSITDPAITAATTATSVAFKYLHIAIS